MDIEKGNLSKNLAITPLSFKSKGDTTISTSNLVLSNAQSTNSISSDETNGRCKPEAITRNGKKNFELFIFRKYWENAIWPAMFNEDYKYPNKNTCSHFHK